MIRSLRESHSIPVFEGVRSRGHRDVPVWKLAVEGGVGALRERRALRGVEGFVQFIGFPRSGHSLIGSVLDAHPRAVISHELDAMGLFEKGLPARAIDALIMRNSAAFSAHGRWWNGFSYAVPWQPKGRAEAIRVIGDKKGDWAVRWFQRQPRLVEAVRRRARGACKWILVTRHPLDNIATMSLRKNRTYDKLRIASGGSADFRARLEAAQEAGAVGSAARDDMIEDYEGLCVGIEQMQAAVPEGDRVHVVYERFVKDPAGEIRDLCRFLNLDPDEAYVAAAASIVRSSPNQSRNAVSWTNAQRARVARLVDRFAFLAPYEDGAGAA